MIKKVYKMLFPVSAVVTILDVPKYCLCMPIERRNRIARSRVSFNEQERIGGGSYGNVYKGCVLCSLFMHRKLDDKPVAIKVLNTSGVPGNEKSQLREIAVGASASNSKYLVTVYGYIYDDSMTAIVMECGETDLEQYIDKGGFKTNKERVDCLLQIARGIQQLHNQGIVDRDIKVSVASRSKGQAKNVILVGNVWKLCDFGLSRYIGNDSLMLSSVGTPTLLLLEWAMRRSQSPENATKNICSTAMDVYSFGCLVAHVMTGKHGFAMYCVKDEEVAMGRGCEDQIANWTEKGLIPCLPSSVDKGASSR